MTDRIKHRLASETSKVSNNTDAYMKVNFESDHKLLPSGDINHILNVGEQFNIERQTSGKYRLLGTVTTLFSNPLFNVTGSDSWTDFDNTKFRDRTLPPNSNLNDDEDLNYNESIATHLKEVNGWFGYFEPDLTKPELCKFFDMEPKRERFSLTPDILHGNVKNWDLTITYPAAIDSGHTLVNGGLLIFDSVVSSVGNRPMLALGTPVKHNLSIGDTVKITGTNLDGNYTVVRLGLDTGDFKEYYFVIEVLLDTNNTSPIMAISTNSRMQRMIGDVPARYYFRKFRKVKTVNVNINMGIVELDDYEIYPLVFSKTIYQDQIYQFVFNEDINVSNLVDNLGRPISELYLTLVKTDSGSMFTNVSAGIMCPDIDNIHNNILIPDIRRIHNGGATPIQSHAPLTNNVVGNLNTFYGDVVEYHPFQVKEVILSDVAHRFNTVNRELPSSGVANGPRQEGYYYKAHHQIKIRHFSNYVEQGDLSTGGIPDYAENLGDGRWLWRDLLDIGYNDGQLEPLDYPFLNGCNYIHKNYLFTLRRQDPFNTIGLYYGTNPPDPIGDSINDKFRINTVNNDC